MGKRQSPEVHGSGIAIARKKKRSFRKASKGSPTRGVDDLLSRAIRQAYLRTLGY
jgi:hypothetical protein